MPSRVISVVFVAFLALAVAEVTLAVGGDRVGEPQYWYSPTAQALVPEMDRLAEAGVESDMMLAGSSMVQFGLLPSVLEAELGSVTASHNSGVPKGYTTVTERWLLEEVLPRVPATRVVWGLSSIDFNGGRPTPARPEYDSARATAPGFFGALDRRLWAVSRLARYRELLRDPSFLSGVFEAPAPQPPLRELDDLMSPGVWPKLEQTPETLRDLRTSLLADFHVGPEHAAAFEYTIRRLQEDGIDVVVVLLPVAEAYVEAHPDAAADYDDFVDWIESEAKRLGVPFFDHGRDIAEERFLDFNHIDREGAVLLTELVAEDLRGLGW